VFWSRADVGSVVKVVGDGVSVFDGAYDAATAVWRDIQLYQFCDAEVLHEGLLTLDDIYATCCFC
jgi:hypothetical protein